MALERFAPLVVGLAVAMLGLAALKLKVHLLGRLATLLSLASGIVVHAQPRIQFEIGTSLKVHSAIAVAHVAAVGVRGVFANYDRPG